jgi:septal ring factor EnvC (AmiA/AmiB activator)
MAFHSPRSWLIPALVLAPVLTGGAAAQAQTETAAETRQTLAQAQSQGAAAKARAETLEARAASAVEQADRTAAQAAAIAARIQQAEADIAAQEARLRGIDRQRAALRDELAARQRPLVRLTAALQRLSRRPLAIALFRPGSVRDTVHLRALIATMIPEVRKRTADLRDALAQARALQARARAAQGELRNQEAGLAQRRAALAGIETRQRLAARDVSGSADREAERALALAEQARDLGGLVETLGKADSLRERLAALPGPVLRPDRPGGGETEAGTEAEPSPTGAPAGYLLPSAGRLVTGFGEISAGVAARGLTLAVRPGAQAVAPAGGRVAFAGSYRGYGEIVILAHDGGWTSLVTGLARLDVRVGDAVVTGSPIGAAGPGQPRIGLELRHDGAPVNPLDILGASDRPDR